MTQAARPTWRAIQDEARRRIAERIWPPGALIPSEHELAAEFECARGTVNRALRELAETGLIERRRKGGTRVAEAPARRARAAVPLIREEIERTGAAYGYALDLAEIGEAPPDVARSFGGDGARLHVVATHYADERPFVREVRWITLEAAPEARRARFDAESANEWLVRNTPFSHGEMAVASKAADEDIAAALRLSTGDPVLEIRRKTFAKDALITVATLSYAPGYQMSLSL